MLKDPDVTLDSTHCDRIVDFRKLQKQTLSRTIGCKCRIVNNLRVSPKNLKNLTVMWTQNNVDENTALWGCICQTKPSVGALV